MKSAEQTLEEIRAVERPIKQQHILQKASSSLPPGELTNLYLQLEQIGGEALCQLAPDYRYMTAAPRRREASTPQLVPHAQVGSTRLYKTPGVAKSKKTLFILFGGKEGEFFIPLSVLLSTLPKGAKDVLIICSGLERYYRDGVKGLGVNPFEVSTNISEQFETAAYSRVLVMGVSVGGIYAIKIAELLRADVGVSFAGVYAHDAFRLQQAVNAGAHAFDPVCDCTTSKKTRIINVVSTKNEFDHLASLRLKKMRPNLIQVHQMKAERHNVMVRMLKTNTAALFMKLALAKSGVAIWLVGQITHAVGSSVRAARRLSGRQKVQEWYMKDRI